MGGGQISRKIALRNFNLQYGDPKRHLPYWACARVRRAINPYHRHNFVLELGSQNKSAKRKQAAAVCHRVDARLTRIIAPKTQYLRQYVTSLLNALTASMINDCVYTLKYSVFNDSYDTPEKHSQSLASRARGSKMVANISHNFQQFCNSYFH